MPRTHIDLPTGTHASWLDTLPPSPPSSPPRRQPKATPQMLSRIHALQRSLSIIKLSLDTRKLMQLSHQHSGAYCPICSPNLTRGTCGSTCPLLRPYPIRSPFYGIADGDWYRQLASDKAKYREVTADMAARGTRVYASTVARWERAVGKLRKRVEVPSEKWEAKGWPANMGVDLKRRAVFKNGWSFEGAWGRGQAVERDGEVAPEVRGGGRGAKRNVGERVDVDANGDDRLVEDVGKRVKRM